MSKNIDWISTLLKYSPLLEAKQAIACIHDGSTPIIIDNQSFSEDFDAVLETRIRNLETIEKSDYEKYLLCATIELLNNLRLSNCRHFISAAISTKGGRFLLYITPDKKKLLGCLFNANKKYRPDTFESIDLIDFPQIIDIPPKKPIDRSTKLVIIILIATLLIKFWPYINGQVNHYLDKPCLNHVIEENFHNAYTICSKRMNDGSHIAMYMVGKLYQEGKGVTKNYTQSEVLYWKITQKEDISSALAYESLGDLYKTREFKKMDYSKSTQFYRIAADKELASSQLQYGLALYIGRGAERNEEQAMVYISKSAKNGNKTAKKLLNDLSTIPSELLLDKINKKLHQ